MSQSLCKALHLLKHLGAMPDGAGVRELGRMSGLNPSTVHALLKTLQAEGFVAWDNATRRYRLGLAMATLGAAIDRMACLQSVVQPVVDALFAELGESVTVVAWQDGRARVVCKHQSAHQLVTALPDGVVQHPHRWASGLLLLAHQPEAVRRAYAVGAASAGDLPDEGVLAQVRAASHNESIDLGGSGVAALAVPVADALGAVRLALAVSAPLARFPEPVRATALAALHRCAADLTIALGAVA